MPPDLPVAPGQEPGSSPTRDEGIAAPATAPPEAPTLRAPAAAPEDAPAPVEEKRAAPALQDDPELVVPVPVPAPEDSSPPPVPIAQPPVSFTPLPGELAAVSPEVAHAAPAEDDEEVIEVDEVGVDMEPGPIEQALQGKESETWQDRIDLYERELRRESSRARAALLEHEIGDQLERLAHDEAGAVKAYARSLASDPMLRPNLWAVRRIFYRRRLWPSLLKLLDAETRYASSDVERAELWTEKGHVYEDQLGDLDEAVKCYAGAHRLDPAALAPLAALEKVFAQQKDRASLLEVYQGLAAATLEPGRRVALLVDLARIEEAEYGAQAQASDAQAGGAAASPEGTALDRAIGYLHAAYEVGVDQLRVVDEIVRITSAQGRVPECLAALDVKAELLDMQGQQAPSQRQQLLGDEVVAIRRWQANLCRDELGDLQAAWQYLQAADQRSPGDPLVLHDLLDLSEQLGRWEDLEALLGRTAKHGRAEDAEMSARQLLRRADALRGAGRDAEAETIEAEVLRLEPGHLPLVLRRERRALRHRDLKDLARIYREEADLAARGVRLGPGEEPRPDPLWATAALLRAGTCLLRAGEYAEAEATLREAQAQVQANLPQGEPLATQWGPRQRLLRDALEQVYEQTQNFAALAALYAEERIETGPAAEGRVAAIGPRAHRLHEAQAELYAEHLGDLPRALDHNAALGRLQPDDLRLRLRTVELCRRLADARAEEEALRALLDLEERLEPAGAAAAQPRGLQPLLRDELRLRRAELLGGSLGDQAAAIALYQEVLRDRPGEPQALEALEQLLMTSGRYQDMQELLRRQADACGLRAAQDPVEAQRLVTLQVKLAELSEQQLAQPEQAAEVYRDLLLRRPGHLPALRALARLYERLRDGARLASTLELTADALPDGEARADVLFRLGEVHENLLGRPVDAEDAYARAMKALPAGDPLLAHAAFGRFRALSRQRSPEAQPVLLAAFPEELCAAGERPGLPVPELLALGEAARHRDGAAEEAALGRLAAQLQQETGAVAAAAGLLLRAGLVGSLSEESAEGPGDYRAALLGAYRASPECAEAAMAIADACEGSAEVPAEALPVFPGRRALFPADDTDDQLLLTLAEAESLLASADRRRAAEASLAALQLDPHSVPALLLLRQAATPDSGTTDPAALRAYAHSTLALAAELTMPARKAELYAEAAPLLLRASDPEGAAAALRAVLDHAPHDAAAFGQAYDLLMKRAQPEGEGGQDDPGPLLELINFRLEHEADDEALRAAEVPLRTALLLQRATLYQAAGDADRAIVDLQALLLLEPEHLAGRRRLADLLGQRGEVEAALAHYERFLAQPGDEREQRAAHIQIAALCAETDPRRASRHLQAAIDISQRQRLRNPVQSPEETLAESAVYRWQVKLLLHQRAYPEAVAVLWQLATLLPPGPEHGIEQARIELEIADILQHEAGDLRGALSALERALRADPLSLEALDRLVPLCAELKDPQRQLAFLERAVSEARSQAAQQKGDEINREPYHALAQIFAWQGLADAQHLAQQAEAAVSAARPPRFRAPMGPQGSLESPVATRAFDAEARGVLYELWHAIGDSATRLLAPDLAALQSSPKDRLNGRAVPPVWEPLERLAQRFGLGGSGLPYGLYLSRERELCGATGLNLVCGSAFAAEVRDLPPRLYFRLLRQLALLPDQLTPVLVLSSDDILLFIAACCRLVEVRGPEVLWDQRERLDERTRALGRVLTRKERRALQALGPRIDSHLAFHGGRTRIEGWVQAIRTGAARLALALSGDLQAALQETQADLRSTDATSAQMARALILFSVSVEIGEMRRELGLAGQEKERGLV